MENMVNIFLFGKKYTVPSNLTIMRAMEYAGYQLVRGCGCRNGFCGACATIYRIKGDRELKTCLACQTKVEDNMYTFSSSIHHPFGGKVCFFVINKGDGGSYNPTCRISHSNGNDLVADA